ncbi:DUF1003 domain-containing protein [Ancylobacter lacus]|uniref:DUF1003 domain-containing protein n=1 Tax=Ancylobacter lacus TaxID=2579970 RepID=UPI001BCB4B49|nr:DUF1003 domain-containing protein [Ancylobacter lacus]MBS7538402.1 DUF1003 domain-containing protein [Ancylobacter lacus]
MATRLARDTTATPQPADLAGVLARNVRALTDRDREQQAKAALSVRIADRVTAFTGSMLFVAVHLAILAAWIVLNSGLAPERLRFDPSFIILATSASVEAIFLSTFVLISQNRAMEASRRQAELDLQINLLTEHELTRLIGLVVAIASRLDVEAAQDPALGELLKHVAPEKVLDHIARETGEGRESGGR